MKSLLILFYLLSIVFVWGINVPQATARDTAGTIRAVEVQGNSEVGSATILAKVKTRPGELFDQNALNDDIKRLYATGYFSDVQVELEKKPEGVHVFFVVVEKDRLDEIIIEGNKSIKKNQILSEFQSRVGLPLDERQLREDIKAVRALYTSKGYQLATVEFEVDSDPERKRSTVYVRIHEGGKLKIRKIFVRGNKVFSDKVILKTIQTRARGLLASGILDDEIFEVDIERIKFRYWQEGYADIDVIPSFHYESEGRKTGMYIVLSIDEGEQYLAGAPEVTGNVLFPASDILARTKMAANTPFSRFHLQDDLNRIQSYYFEKGYVNAQVKADTRLNETSQVIDVKYRIQENRLAYVDQIEIVGNDKTRDQVIRREIRLKPGDRFDGAKLKRSQQRLTNLGYFEEVSYDTKPGSSSDDRNLVIKVKERKTGEFTFGAGFSTARQFVGFVDVTQRNFDISGWPSFVGGGQQLRFRAEAGSTTQDFELSFTEPWIFGYPLLFGVDFFGRTFEREDYDEERKGGTLRLAKSFAEYYSANIGYTFQEIDVTDVAVDASSDIRDEQGESTVSAVQGGVSYNTLDNIFAPHSGEAIRVDGNLFGSVLGGDRDFYKIQIDAKKYFPLYLDHVLELRLRLGVAENFDNTERVPIYERFFAGGSSTIRGYNFRRVGPIEGGDPIGGNTLIVANAEYIFPLVEDLVKGAVFFDVGNVFRQSYDFNLTDLREGVGAGVRIKTPIGPVRLDYGFPLDLPTDEENDQGRFYFDIERGF